MQREIKFRIWNGLKMEHNIMAGFLGAFYVQGIDDKDTSCISQFNTKYHEETPLMQFTGLKDKNGKEIYEGDIMGLKKGGSFGEVVFWRDAWYLKLNKDTHAVIYVGETVIGNIFEDTIFNLELSPKRNLIHKK